MKSEISRPSFDPRNEGFMEIAQEFQFRGAFESTKCKYSNGFWFFLQELDNAYMGKMEFDVRVDILRQQLEFLRCLYEAVSD